MISKLQDEGMTTKEISKELGLTYNTVYYLMSKPKKVSSVKKSSGSNADRKKCRTCMYRGKKNGCDYIEIVGHSRGCSVEECTVYEKGNPKTKGDK